MSSAEDIIIPRRIINSYKAINNMADMMRGMDAEDITVELITAFEGLLNKTNPETPEERTRAGLVAHLYTTHTQGFKAFIKQAGMEYLILWTTPSAVITALGSFKHLKIQITDSGYRLEICRTENAEHPAIKAIAAVQRPYAHVASTAPNQPITHKPMRKPRKQQNQHAFKKVQPAAKPSTLELLEKDLQPAAKDVSDSKSDKDSEDIEITE